MDAFCDQCQSAHAVINDDPTALFGDVLRPEDRLTSANVRAGLAAMRGVPNLRPVDVERMLLDEWMVDLTS